MAEKNAVWTPKFAYEQAKQLQTMLRIRATLDSNFSFYEFSTIIGEVGKAPQYVGDWSFDFRSIHANALYDHKALLTELHLHILRKHALSVAKNTIKSVRYGSKFSTSSGKLTITSLVFATNYLIELGECTDG